MADQLPYNPLDKRNLGSSVVDALLQESPEPIAELGEFQGAGIYAIYYIGDLELYSELSKRNRSEIYAWPIYVGKAIPEGTRKGATTAGEYKGKALSKRLNEHTKSLEQATNLTSSDFQCRYLKVDDIWIPLAESVLIEKLMPPWNCVLDGFGNHTPGKGRFNQQRSFWDVVHPGRNWAEKCAPNAKSQEDILIELNSFIDKAAKFFA